MLDFLKRFYKKKVDTSEDELERHLYGFAQITRSNAKVRNYLDELCAVYGIEPKECDAFFASYMATEANPEWTNELASIMGKDNNLDNRFDLALEKGISKEVVDKAHNDPIYKCLMLVHLRLSYSASSTKLDTPIDQAEENRAVRFLELLPETIDGLSCEGVKIKVYPDQLKSASLSFKDSSNLCTIYAWASGPEAESEHRDISINDRVINELRVQALQLSQFGISIPENAEIFPIDPKTGEWSCGVINFRLDTKGSIGQLLIVSNERFSAKLRGDYSSENKANIFVKHFLSWFLKYQDEGLI